MIRCMIIFSNGSSWYLEPVEEELVKVVTPAEIWLVKFSTVMATLPFKFSVHLDFKFSQSLL